MKRTLLIAVIILVLIGIGIGIYASSQNHKNTGFILSGNVETHEVQVGSKVGGRVSEVLVSEGQLLKAGDPLVRFDVSELLAQKKQLEAKIAQAEANLAKLQHGFRPEEVAQAEAAAQREKATLEAMRNGPRPQEIAQAKADLAAAEADLTNAESTLHRIEQLYASGDLSKQALDDAKNRREAAAKRVEALRQRVALLEAGTRQEDLRAGEERFNQAQENARMMRSGARAEDIADARARLSEMKALLEQNKIQLAEGEVKAPVESRLEVLSVRPGDLVPPSKPVATLLEQDQLWVRVYVPEPELGRVFVGQKVEVRIDTFPGRTFPGSVEQIASQAEFLPRNIQSRSERNHQVFSVKVRIDNKENILKSGMAADVTLFQ